MSINSISSATMPVDCLFRSSPRTKTPAEGVAKGGDTSAGLTFDGAFVSNDPPAPVGTDGTFVSNDPPASITVDGKFESRTNSDYGKLGQALKSGDLDQATQIFAQIRAKGRGKVGEIKRPDIDHLDNKDHEKDGTKGAAARGSLRTDVLALAKGEKFGSLGEFNKAWMYKMAERQGQAAQLRFADTGVNITA